jgi:hypothetical protein
MSKRDKVLSALGLNVRKNREACEFTQEKGGEAKEGLKTWKRLAGKWTESLKRAKRKLGQRRKLQTE